MYCICACAPQPQWQRCRTLLVVIHSFGFLTTCGGLRTPSTGFQCQAHFHTTNMCAKAAPNTLLWWWSSYMEKTLSPTFAIIAARWPLWGTTFGGTSAEFIGHKDRSERRQSSFFAAIVNFCDNHQFLRQSVIVLRQFLGAPICYPSYPSDLFSRKHLRSKVLCAHSPHPQFAMKWVVDRVTKKPPSSYSVRKYIRIIHNEPVNERKPYLLYLKEAWPLLFKALKESGDTLILDLLK